MLPIHDLHEAVRRRGVSLIDTENDAIALGGAQGRWRQFSNATLEDWGKCTEALRANGGVE